MVESYIIHITPILVAAFASWFTEWLQTPSGKAKKDRVAEIVNKLPSWVKQVIVSTIAFLTTYLANFFTVQLTGHAVTDFGALLAATLAFIFHNGRQNRWILGNQNAIIRQSLADTTVHLSQRPPETLQ